jgi:hypothetical protein
VSGLTVNQRGVLVFVFEIMAVRHSQPKPALIPQAVLRQARLVAFASLFEEWLEVGKARDYGELAENTGFDRSRITRIMNLWLQEGLTAFNKK